MTHDEAVKALIEDTHEDDGWLSDAQDAGLEADLWSGTIHFCGEGAIDVNHLVSIVLGE